MVYILDHPKIENSGNTVINIIMWILTTNYWAKVKIQRISYTSLQQILTKHKVKRRRNLGSRTTTKLLGFQIHEKKSLSSLCIHNMNCTYGSHRNIFDKALFKCLGRFFFKRRVRELICVLERLTCIFVT